MRSTLTICLFLVLHLCTDAQVWVDKGAEWHYSWYGPISGGFVKINYVNDTTIQNKNCQVLSKNQYYFQLDMMTNTIHYTGSNIIGIEYTYVSGDTVFYLVNGSFKILYNFGAQPGDSWNLGTDTTGSFCSAPTVFVDSIGSVNLNNTTYRWIYIRTPQYGGAIFNGKIVERLGNITGYLFPEVNFCDTMIIADLSHFGSFMCFQDNSFALYNTTGQADCEWLLTSDVKTENEIIDIMPNPSSNVINIKGLTNNNSASTIYSVTGFVETVKGSKINIQDLAAGCYTIVINYNNKQIVKRFIKQNDF